MFFRDVAGHDHVFHVLRVKSEAKYSLSGHDMTWQDMAGHGRTWQDMI